MRRISSMGIRGSNFRLVCGILFAAAVGVALMAVFSLQEADLLIALVVAAALFMCIIVLRLVKVTIDVSATHMIIAFRPFFSRRLALSDVMSVTVSPTTSAGEGFGYRVLGKNQRGLLAGGPSVTIHTSDRVWVVSSSNPKAVTAVIESQSSERSQS